MNILRSQLKGIELPLATERPTAATKSWISSQLKGVELPLATGLAAYAQRPLDLSQLKGIELPLATSQPQSVDTQLIGVST